MVNVPDGGAIGDSVLISVCLGVVFQMRIVAIDGALLFLPACWLRLIGLFSCVWSLSLRPIVVRVSSRISVRGNRAF